VEGHLQRRQPGVVGVERSRGALADSAFWTSGLAVALLIAAVTLVGLASLLRTPAPFIDEGWFASRAWAFIHTGQNFGSMDRGVFDRYDGYWTYFPWLPTFFQSLAFRALGLSLFSLRLASFVFGMVLVLATYVIADRLAGRSVALLTVLLVSLSRAFLYSSHLGRPDIFAATFGFGALALYAWDRSPRLSVASVLSGLAVGLAFESWPYGLLYGPTLAVLYLLEYRRALLRALRFWGFATGAAAGLALYAWLHILPYPQTYLAISRLIAIGSGEGRTPPLLSMDPDVWMQTTLDMVWQFMSLWNLRIPLVVGGVVVLWRSRSASERKLLGICVVLLLAYLFLVRNKGPWYAILVAPAGDLLAAVFLARLWRTIRSGAAAAYLRQAPLVGRFRLPSAALAVGQPARALVVVALIGAAIAPTLSRTIHDPRDDYQDTVDHIRATVRPGSTVMGPSTYWFGLSNERYFSWEHLVYYRAYAPGSTLGDALHEFEPDYFIIDTYIDKFFRDTPRPSVTALQLVLSRTEFDSFLSQRGRLAAVIENDTYGRVRIYEIDWSRRPV